MLLGEGDGGSSLYGAFASKIGSGAAKAGKKFAQSEAGRSATRAAMKGATDAAVNDISNRYLGPEPTPPTKQTTPTVTPTKSATPSATSSVQPMQTTPTNDSDDGSHRNESYQWTRPPPKPSLLARFKPNINLKLQSDDKPRPRPRRVPNKDRVFKYAAIDKADWESLPRAITLYNFRAEMKCDLEFRKGQIINVITKSDSTNDWWEGRIDDRVGIFPANYVKMM